MAHRYTNNLKVSPPPVRNILIVYYFIKFRTECPAKNGKISNRSVTGGLWTDKYLKSSSKLTIVPFFHIVFVKNIAFFDARMGRAVKTGTYPNSC